MGKSNKFSLTTKSHSSTRVNPYDKITLNALNVSCPDKQIVLPKLDSNGAQLIFIELYSLFIFIIALGTQYLNLYRTNWLLSKSSTATTASSASRTNQASSLHPINDLDISQFSLIFIGQSSLISILRALLKKATLPANLNTLFSQYHFHSLSQPVASNNTTTTTTTTSTLTPQTIAPPTSHSTELCKQQQQLGSNSQSQSTSQATSSKTLTTIIIATASWICNYYLFKSAFRIWVTFGFNGLLCVSYPIVSILSKSEITISPKLSTFRFDDDKLCHICSNQPDEIRDEVERLRTIFNERLKFVLYKSILLAYYSSFVPICFAQSYPYYDHTWTAQHVVTTWFSCLIMLISSSYTPHFYDVLHRSAYHFGKWQKLEARNTLVPCINWSENVIYPQGVVVKHYRGYFRSESVSNCAQPGVSSHLLYYVAFSNPKIGYVAALILLGLLLTAQMYLLLISTEWYKLIAMTSMMLINVHSIFRLVKSLVVITKIYKRKH